MSKQTYIPMSKETLGDKTALSILKTNSRLCGFDLESSRNHMFPSSPYDIPRHRLAWGEYLYQKWLHDNEMNVYEFMRVKFGDDGGEGIEYNRKAEYDHDGHKRGEYVSYHITDAILIEYYIRLKDKTPKGSDKLVVEALKDISDSLGISIYATVDPLDTSAMMMFFGCGFVSYRESYDTYGSAILVYRAKTRDYETYTKSPTWYINDMAAKALSGLIKEFETGDRFEKKSANFSYGMLPMAVRNIHIVSFNNDNQGEIFYKLAGLILWAQACDLTITIDKRVQMTGRLAHRLENSQFGFKSSKDHVAFSIFDQELLVFDNGPNGWYEIEGSYEIIPFEYLHRNGMPSFKEFNGKLISDKLIELQDHEGED